MKSFKKNAAYIWDYYKVPIFAVPLLLLLMIYFIFGVLVSEKEPFYLYIINHSVSEDARVQLEADLSSIWNGNEDIDGVSVDTSLTITPETPDHDSQMSFTSSIAGHTIDVMIADVEFLDYYAKMNALTDLSELLPSEFSDTLSPYLVMAEDENGTARAYGLDVSGCSALSALLPDRSILTIARVSEHKDAAVSLIRYLFG